MIKAIIAPEMVPKSSIAWPAAYRLRPVSLPARKGFADGTDDLAELISLCAPLARHERGIVPVGFSAGYQIPPTIKVAFASPAPEWQFAPALLPHVVVANRLKTALDLCVDQFGQFLADTVQGPCQLSFVVDRYTLTGEFHDITDQEVFGACYNSLDQTVSHQLMAALQKQGADGLMYLHKTGQCAVVLNPEGFSRHGQERALTLNWDGSKFSRVFDYRGLYWSDLDS